MWCNLRLSVLKLCKDQEIWHAKKIMLDFEFLKNKIINYTTFVFIRKVCKKRRYWINPIKSFLNIFMRPLRKCIAVKFQSVHLSLMHFEASISRYSVSKLTFSLCRTKPLLCSANHKVLEHTPLNANGYFILQST